MGARSASIGFVACVLRDGIGLHRTKTERRGCDGRNTSRRGFDGRNTSTKLKQTRLPPLSWIAPLRIFRYDDDRQKWREVRHYNEISRHDPFATLTTLLTTQRTDRRGSYPKARSVIETDSTASKDKHPIRSPPKIDVF
ncbi:hypothetical protein THAOC_17601 [Thalassiosira oceanica]|uniref:Uncharacterized protein n=1 Tax=Thalassiosira oceanica TaxID=159749 RepID=K0SUA9_THAOC|nr:hypothetical protein THAOC_17601 [Thalassiosira oceanica]|eukprot:EJK61837.1 hypothetical protein THAOC_17601 [Thalassiosira oceanica]